MFAVVVVVGTGVVVVGTTCLCVSGISFSEKSQPILLIKHKRRKSAGESFFLFFGDCVVTGTVEINVAKVDVVVLVLVVVDNVVEVVKEAVVFVLIVDVVEVVVLIVVVAVVVDDTVVGDVETDTASVVKKYSVVEGAGVTIITESSFLFGTSLLELVEN